MRLRCSLKHSSAMKTSPCAAPRTLLSQKIPSLSIACAFVALIANFDIAHEFVAHRGGGAPISVAVVAWWGLLLWLPHFSTAAFATDFSVEFAPRRSFARYGIAVLMFACSHSAHGCRHASSILSGQLTSSDNKK